MFKKLIAKLSNVVVVICLVTIVLSAVVSFFNTNQAKEQIAALNESVKINTAQIKVLNIENQKLTESNQVLITSNKQLTDQTRANSLAIKQGVEDAKILAANRPTYPEECKPVVEYMQKEINAYVYNFSLAIKDRDTWKQLSDNWNLAYNNQVKITINTQTAMGLVVSDSVKKDEIIKNLNKKLTVNKIQRWALSGGIAAILATVVVWTMVK